MTAAPPDQSLLSVVLLGTNDAVSIGESFTSALEYCVGIRQSDTALVLHGSAVAHFGLFSQLGQDIAVLTSDFSSSISDAWALGIGSSNSSWVLLMSDDIRLTPGWLNPLLEYIAEHPDCTSITPTVMAGASRLTTGTPDQSRGVCLLLSRAALVEGRITETVHVKESEVLSVGAVNVSAGTFSMLRQVSTSPAPITTSVKPSAPDVRISLGTDVNGWATKRELSSVAGDSVEFIYSEQYLQKLDFETGIMLLAECHRVLKPNGVLRVAVCDVRDFVLSYLGRWDKTNVVEAQPEVDSAMRMLNVAMGPIAYGWDEAELKMRLTQAGFGRLVVCHSGQSSISTFTGLEESPDSALIIEATK